MKNKAKHLHPFFDEDDVRLCGQMPSVSFLSDRVEDIPEDAATLSRLYDPCDRFRFLHECAVIEFKGTLYASWYNNPQTELHGYTPICEMRSRDGGKTWTPMEIVAHDESARILYCPPVYGIDEGRLYMLINEMVGADLMHSLDLYVLDEESDRFEKVWSRPIPLQAQYERCYALKRKAASSGASCRA